MMLHTYNNSVIQLLKLMQQEKVESTMNAPVAQKEQANIKDGFEANTACKVKPKRKLGMDHIPTTKQKYALQDMQARHVRETEKTKQQKEKRKNRSLNSLAFFHFLKQMVPSIVGKSKKNLFLIAQQSRQKVIRSMFSQEQISYQLQQVYYQGFRSFYKHSTKIIEGKMQKLLQTLVYENESCNYDVQLQILSLCLKNVQQFELCLDQKDTKYITCAKFEKLLGLPAKKISFFVKLYERHRGHLKYIEFNPLLQQLFASYYLLNVKSNIFKASIQQNEETQIYVKRSMQDMRRRVELRQSFVSQKEQQKFLLSQFHNCAAKRQLRKIKKGSLEDIIDILTKYQEIIQKGLTNQQKRRILQRLGAKYQRNYCKITFTQYEKWTKQNRQIYGNDLSELKRIVIGKHLNQNSYYNYEQIIMKAFYGKPHVFIDRQFYDENIVDILKRETQYHQLVYLNRVIEGIQMRKSQGTQIIFADYFHTAGEEKEMKDQSEDYSIIAAVGINGSLQCRMYPRKIQNFQFLSEVAKMFRNNNKQSVYIFYDRKFPYSKWLKREQIVLLRRRDILTSLPFIEAVPNPCQNVCQLIWKLMKQKMGRSSLQKLNPEALFQQAVSIYQDKQIIISDILGKEWNKVKDFTFQQPESGTMHEQKAIVQREDYQEEHFDEESSQNVQRKLFKQEEDNHLSEQINDEESQRSSPANYSAEQSNQSGIVLNKMRDFSLENQASKGKDQTNNSTQQKKKRLNPFANDESHKQDSDDDPSMGEISKDNHRFQDRFDTFICNHGSKQIPIMENLDSMNELQLRRLLPIITSFHCTHILPSQIQRQFNLAPLKSL